MSTDHTHVRYLSAMMHVILKCEQPLNLYLILRSVLGYVCVAVVLPSGESRHQAGRESAREWVYDEKTTFDFGNDIFV